MALTPEQIRQEQDRRSGRNHGGKGRLALPWWRRARGRVVMARMTEAELAAALVRLGARLDPPWWSRSDAYAKDPADA